MSLICNELLGVERIKIYQDSDLFNFSLDSMLLASFATVNLRDKNICDLCSGNAPIPMYLTLRTKAKITGVEVLKKSYDLAMMSIKENKMEEQISMVNANLINISDELGKEKFDLITCNPPYFKLNHHQINPNEEKAVARHEILATLDDIVCEAAKLLKQKGRLAMIHTPGRLLEVIDTFKKYHIEPKRLRLVYPKKDGECNHILIEGIKDGNSELRILPPLFVYKDDGKWTEEVLKIYNFEE